MSGKDKMLAELIDKVNEQHCSAIGRKKVVRNAGGIESKELDKEVPAPHDCQRGGRYEVWVKVKGVCSTD